MLQSDVTNPLQPIYDNSHRYVGIIVYKPYPIIINYLLFQLLTLLFGGGGVRQAQSRAIHNRPKTLYVSHT